MKIKWYGHSCFVISRNGYSVIIDPYSPNSVPGLSMPTLDVNKVLCTHSHEDHNYKNGVRVVKKDVCPFRFSTVKTFHDGENGARRGKNSVFVLECDGLRIAHFGDIGCIPDDKQLKEIGRLDAALMPVGGYYTVNAEGAAEIIRRLEDVKVIIPMHYRTVDAGYGVLDTVDRFAELIDDRECYEYGNEITLDTDTERQLAILTL